MQQDLIADIGKIAVFLLLFLAVFLITIPSKNKLANRLFAAFLVVTSFDFTAIFIETVYVDSPMLNHLRIASVFLQMPLFYFYVKAICYHNFRLSAKQLAHAIPFVVFLLIFSIYGLSEQNYRWYGILAQLQYYIYIFGVFYTLTRYKKVNLENYALKNETYKWLLTVTILFLIGNCFVLFRSVYETFYDASGLAPLNLGISLFGLTIISWFVLKTMRTPQLFKGIDKQLKPLEKVKVIEQEVHDEEIEYLTNYMIEHKPYLKDTLTLQGLAEQTEIPEKHLSFLINKVIGTHFFDYINAYRIQAAQELLKGCELNIQQIMYDVGFNSKSSFNTAFKKHTSLTPSAYRKSIS